MAHARAYDGRALDAAPQKPELSDLGGIGILVGLALVVCGEHQQQDKPPKDTAVALPSDDDDIALLSDVEEARGPVQPLGVSHATKS